MTVNFYRIEPDQAADSNTWDLSPVDEAAQMTNRRAQPLGFRFDVVVVALGYRHSNLRLARTLPGGIEVLCKAHSTILSTGTCRAQKSAGDT